jgi:hypothetical protein
MMAVMMALIVIISTTDVVEGFQWMSKFKMPTYDPQQDAVKDKFGDKSAYNTTHILLRHCVV